MSRRTAPCRRPVGSQRGAARGAPAARMAPRGGGGGALTADTGAQPQLWYPGVWRVCSCECCGSLRPLTARSTTAVITDMTGINDNRAATLSCATALMTSFVQSHPGISRFEQAVISPSHGPPFSRSQSVTNPQLDRDIRVRLPERTMADDVRHEPSRERAASLRGPRAASLFSPFCCNAPFHLGTVMNRGL